ncbi:MAG: 2-oxoacid:acceptor oxidoreductase family protein [Desulfurococcaceae archaeon]
MLYEIIFYGRGGQGAVTASHLLVEAAMYEGKYGQGFPFFGAERRGAPVTAYTRLSDKPILRHGMFDEADILVIFDDSILDLGITKRIALRDSGIIVINTERKNIPLENVNSKGKFTVYVVNATKISRELGLVVAGWPLVNTAMLGAFSRASRLVSIESIKNAIMNYFGSKIGTVNAMAAQRAHDEITLLGEPV